MGPYDWLILSIVVFIILAAIVNYISISRDKDLNKKPLEKSQNLKSTSTTKINVVRGKNKS